MRYDVCMIVFLYAMFGAIIGSFLNVLVLRHGTGRTIRGRSACASCCRKLTVLELVPIVSWIYLRGRCRACGSAISIQYPLVEFVTAVLFGVVGGMALPLIHSIIVCGIVATLVAIAVYDIRHTILPDTWVFSFFVLACIFSFLLGKEIEWIISGICASTLPLFALWFFSDGKAMGLGDVKLVTGFGTLLGPLFGIFTVGFAFVLGSMFFIPVLAVSHMRRSSSSATRVTMRSEVPFGPFLIISFFIVWISAQYGISIPEALGLVW